ncbi:hypothetical protein F2Q69_00052914 [Brassica cretica]|uniref:Uncharacterized protein n=1 Tax=Brassica cretica TaxID=69181 RepID=A0A8S9N2U7_BRACR|nr:hypothetical protein F2Q69_00052914 [Brassica cretica]
MTTGLDVRPVSICRPVRTLDRSPYGDRFGCSTGRHMPTSSDARPVAIWGPVHVLDWSPYHELAEHSPYGDRIGRSTGRHMATSLDARFGVAGVNFVVTGFDPNS